MFEDLMSDYGSRLFIAIAGVGLALLCLFVVLMMMRRRSGPAPFLRGGKNRQPRLQVLDAAAVDARRRIVLIRRDDVEHLVMIGGPTDVVIESGIGAAPARPVSLAPQEPETAALPQPVPEPRLQAPARQPQLSAPTAAAMPAIEPAATPSLRERVLASPPSPAATPASRREQRSPAATRVEPAVAASERSNAAPSATIAASAAPQPESRLAEPRLAEPRQTEPAQPPKPEPARDTMVEIEPPASARPVQQTNAQISAQSGTQTGAPDIGAASDALDAARRRVFQPAFDRTPPPLAAPLEPATAPAEPTPLVTTQPEPQAPRGLGSDFDRILEEEMANNLAEAAPSAPPGTLPRRDPANPRLTGASPEPSLQQEVARIFGEMSVTRDR